MKANNKPKIIGKTLVALQFLLTTLIIAGGFSDLPRHPAFWVFGILGTIVALAGVAAMTQQTGGVKITPEPRENTPLCNSGIYKYIRHPMYSGLLLGTLMFAPTSALTSLLWLALLITLIAKLTLEESMLTSHVPGYASYKKHTKRLLPFIW